MSPEDCLRLHFVLKDLQPHEICETASVGGSYWCCVRELPGEDGCARQCCWRSVDGHDNVKSLKGHALSRCHKADVKPDKNGTIKLKWEVAYLEGLGDADIAKEVAKNLDEFVNSKLLSAEAKSLLTSAIYQQDGKAALLASLVQHYRREIASKQSKQAKQAKRVPPPASSNVSQAEPSVEVSGNPSLDSTPVASSSRDAISETYSSAASPEVPPVNASHVPFVEPPAPIAPTNWHTATADSLTYGFFQSYIDQTPPAHFDEPERDGQLHLLYYKDNLPFPYTTVDFPCRILANLSSSLRDQARLAARDSSPKTWSYMNFLETYEKTDVEDYIPEAVFVAISALAKDLWLQQKHISTIPDLHAALDSYGGFCYAVTWGFIVHRMVQYIPPDGADLLEQLPNLCLRYLSWLKGGARFDVEVHTRSTEKAVQVDWYHLPELYDEAIRRDYGYSLLAMVAWAATPSYAIRSWGWNPSQPASDWERLRYRYILRRV